MPEYVKAGCEVLQSTPEPLLLIERVGRVCYKSEAGIGPGTAEAFVRMLLARRHEAMVECVSATVKFTVDRGVSHELVRHRLCSFAQESTRYCNYGGKGVKLVHPPGLSQAQLDRREQHFWATQALYDAEVAEGVRPEIARGVLPTCLKTEIIVTANAREWRHVMRLRSAKAAHPQMREVMNLLLPKLQRLFPALFDEFEVTDAQSD